MSSDITITYKNDKVIRVRAVEYEDTALALHIFESETEWSKVPYTNVLCIDFQEAK